MGTWIVVRTKPRCENWAAANLERQGFVCYCPKTAEVVGRGMRRYTVARALFPGFLFVQLAENRWRTILSTYGVTGPIMVGESPGYIRAKAIEELKEREDRDGLIVLPSKRIGSRVQVTRGPMLHRTGIFQGMSGPDRVRVLMEFLGRKITVLIAQNAVEAVAA